MELVYLWVEDYKNIQKQGFNFSPRFRCEFKAEYEKYIDKNGEEKEKLKNDCELTIDENKDYVSIFPENINITAIVGENGSGKSSLCNILDERLINYKINILFFNNKEKIFYYKNFNIKQTSTNYKIESIKDYDYYDKNIICKKIDYKEECIKDTENSQLITLSNVLENDSTCFDFIDKNLVFTSWHIIFSKKLPPNLNTNIKALDDRYSLFNKKYENEEEKYLKVFVYVSIKFVQFILGSNSLQESKYFDSLNNLAENFTKKNYIEFVKLVTLENHNFDVYKLILETLRNFEKTKNL